MKKEFISYLLQLMFIAALLFVGFELRAIHRSIDSFDTVKVENALYPIPLKVQIESDGRSTR